jgi:hypothetical protein
MTTPAPATAPTAPEPQYFARVPLHALADPELTPADKVVLAVLVGLAPRDLKGMVIAIDRIAAAAGLSRRAVRYALPRLDARGYIRLSYHDGKPCTIAFLFGLRGQPQPATIALPTAPEPADPGTVCPPTRAKSAPPPGQILPPSEVRPPDPPIEERAPQKGIRRGSEERNDLPNGHATPGAESRACEEDGSPKSFGHTWRDDQGDRDRQRPPVAPFTPPALPPHITPEVLARSPFLRRVARDKYGVAGL